MKKLLRYAVILVISVLLEGFAAEEISAQTCATSGFCPITAVNPTGQYPSSTYSTTSSSWSTVSAYMNAGNWTLFNVTSGDTYEWTYCSNFGGSQSWDAEMTLFNNADSTQLCYANNCGITGCTNSPYIQWTATFTGVVRLLTTVSGCATNTGSPYSTLIWRDVSGSSSAQILGIDISHYQTVTSWPQAMASGVTFAWIKSTEGVTYDDPDFVSSMTNGESAGIKMGAYHFARPDNNTAADEATHFINIAGSYITSCELPPVLDFETTGSLTGAQLTTWALAWMTAVESATGITPILYTDGSIATSLGSSMHVYPLWMADPDESSTTPPANLGGWSDWAFKQYSWTGVVPGITGNVDMDVFNGDSVALSNLMGCSVVSISEINTADNFIMYPNPANDNITVENTSLNNFPNGIISIYNLQGQLILQQLMQEQKKEINISNLTSGMYIVKINTAKSITVRKLVKE